MSQEEIQAYKELLSEYDLEDKELEKYEEMTNENNQDDN